MLKPSLALNSVAARDDPGRPRWYVVHTHPRAEAVAAQNLCRQGFKTYLPLRVRSVRHARQVKTITDAYFPRYLFVSLDLDQDRWHCVFSTIGVANLLSAGDRPLAVPKGIVESLISVTDSSGLLKPCRLLEPGQKVRVLQGPFAERIGTLDRVRSTDAVYILLAIMDREVPVKVSREAVDAIA